MHRFRLAPVIVALTLLACGGAALPASASASSAPGRFDRGDAARVLSNARKSAERNCASLVGPRGRLHVKTVFASDGSVREAQIDRGYEPGDTSLRFVGTPRGECVEKTFRAARMTAFEGELTSVGIYVTLD